MREGRFMSYIVSFKMYKKISHILWNYTNNEKYLYTCIVNNKQMFNIYYTSNNFSLLSI